VGDLSSIYGTVAVVAAKVASVSAADTSVVVGGTATAPTLQVGDLSGTYAKSGTKRVTAPINSPHGAFGGVATDWLQATVVQLPATTTRWRLKFANRQLQNNTLLTTPMTSTAWYIGSPAKSATDSTGRWSGAFTASPTQCLSGFSVPVDGTDYVSPWVTAGNLQFTRDVPRLLQWATSTPASGTGISSASNVTQSFLNTTGGSALVGQTAPAGFISATLMGDVRIEYEFVGPQQVGVFIGDSITAGLGDGDVTGSYLGTLFNEKYPNVAASRGGFIAVNLGIGSTGLTASPGNVFQSTSNYAWTRADLATTVPDFAVICLGTNDLGGSIAAILTAYRTLIANIRSLGINRIFVGTILPRYGQAFQGYLTANAAAAATTISSTINTGAVPILIGTGRTQETRTVSAVAGTGPYTLTVPALTNAHTGGTSPLLGEQVAFGPGEILRQQLNDWLRQLPDSVSGCIDFAKAFETYSGSASPNAALMSTDLLHPIRSGYSVMAHAAMVGAPVVLS
jgi:lysophospholipase L1-like esterase